MKLGKCRSLFLALSCTFMYSCGQEEVEVHRQVSVDDFGQWNTDSCSLYSGKIRTEIEEMIHDKPATLYADAFLNRYYLEKGSFLWITRNGIDFRADSLLALCSDAKRWGMPSALFQTQPIQKDLERVRALDFASSQEISATYGRLEYRLTQLYLRLLCGLRFGLLEPSRVFNRLDVADTTPQVVYTRLYDIPTERANQAYIRRALNNLSHISFVDSIRASEPATPAYLRMLALYLSPESESYGRYKVLANLERLRWRHTQPDKRYVWVNMASQELIACDEAAGRSLEMKICGGSLKHKTPLLHSRIDYMQIDPYWVIPFSIIKNEIAVRHVGDLGYYERNQIKIIEKGSGEEVDPADVSASMLLSGNYMLRQERGEGNSLGRMIFRFTNNFAVFLHDTNNKGAFARSNRAISHGCIRLEKPLELASFLIDDDETMDKVRLSLDLPPTTDKGRRWQQSDSFKPMSYYRFSAPYPLFITYQTLYFDASGKLRSCGDPYGYDRIIIEKLKNI